MSTSNMSNEAIISSAAWENNTSEYDLTFDQINDICDYLRAGDIELTAKSVTDAINAVVNQFN